MKHMPRTLAAVLAAGTVANAEPFMAADLKNPDAKASVWVVNIPNENASVEIKDAELLLNYHFTGGGQYLGVPVPVDVKESIDVVKFRLFGDNSGSGFNIYLNDASEKTHKFNTGIKIDWTGWKDIEIRVDGDHEMWGGKHKIKRIDWPLKDITFEVGTPGKEVKSQIRFADIQAIPSALIKITSPAYCGDISGDPVIHFNALGFPALASVKSFNAAKGEMQTIATDIAVDAQGNGSFTFPATKFPKGPVTLILTADLTLAGEPQRDNCSLQLYNTTGIEGIHGMPKDPPPAAKGMKLVFADNFEGPLSIGKGPGFKYYDHKPPDGSQDFSQWENEALGCRGYRFTSFDKPNNPFAKVDNFLRIRGSTEAASTGIIASMQGDGSGVKVKAPCYIECRFIAPNAPGSWPAFWTLTDWHGYASGCDELDIIEAYGGEGWGNPSSKFATQEDSWYMICTHMWDQDNNPNRQAILNEVGKTNPNPKRMVQKGVNSAWYENFHTYAVYIGEEETIYYCDDIEMGRHKTFPLSKERPHFFLVNLAIGGISGWKIDLERYDGVVDMYVDYIRVYEGKE